MSGIRRLLRQLRYLPERALHPWRRRRATAEVPRLDDVDGVLFVCHGNICRSPFAEALVRSRAGAREVSFGSAGFVGAGRSPPPVARQVAREWGLDIEGHRSRILDPSELRDRPGWLIFVMESEQAHWLRRRIERTERIFVLGDFDPRKPQRRDIRDPIRGSEELFRTVYRRIDRCVSEALGGLSEAAEPSSSSLGRTG